MVNDMIEIFKAIGNLVKEGKSTLSKAAVVWKPRQSISRKAMDAIADFTVGCEDTLTLEEMSMIGRSLEKRFASFLMVVMSLNPSFDLKDGVSLSDYLKQFHQNLNVSDDIGGLIGGTSLRMEAMSVEEITRVARALGLEYNGIVSEAAGIIHHIYQGVNSQLINAEHAQLQFTIESETNASRINTIGSSVLEAKDNDKYANRQKELVQNVKFEKANDVIPTLLHVRIFPRGNNGQNGDPIDFIIGVHATIHPIHSSDMILNIVRGIRNEDKFFNFIRWTTGEIKFFKDLLFGIDQVKLDAVTSSGSSSELFSVARRQKAMSTLKQAFTNKSMSPNLTIVVTTDCLEKIKNEYGYDLTVTSTTQSPIILKLMATYFMLGFVVVDTGLQRVSILMDGHSKFETYTYSNLQREGTVNDRQFKEMMRMLGRNV